MNEANNTENKIVSEKPTFNLSLPNAIVLASVIIGGAILMSGSAFSGVSVAKNPAQQGAVAQNGAQAADGNLDAVRAISASEHVRGNTNAPVKIVVYSDFECPYCKVYHQSLKSMQAEYVDTGKVVWVERQFPLTSIHPNAKNVAVASECVGEIGGNDAFWKFADKVFETTDSNNTMKGDTLANVARSVGIDVTQFSNCLASSKFDKKINDDATNGSQIGINGTPGSVVIAPNGKKFKIGGAVPYDSLKQTIEQALAEK